MLYVADLRGCAFRTAGLAIRREVRHDRSHGVDVLEGGGGVLEHRAAAVAGPAYPSAARVVSHYHRGGVVKAVVNAVEDVVLSLVEAVHGVVAHLTGDGTVERDQGAFRWQQLAHHRVQGPAGAPDHA